MGGWDVTWLGNSTGWLNGTAFPTWKGNSVLTAHVTNANGLAGPFANIKSLKYGDRVIVHMSGQQYVYEVRDTRLIRPYLTSFAFQDLEGYAYITMITCAGYNADTEEYAFRRVIRTVLVEVETASE
jgi:LPXTG-site transpeptidase (sortase) family protein